MIKSSNYVKIAAVLSFLLFLFIPFKLSQLVCITVFLSILFSFIYIKIIERCLVIERNLEVIRLACTEQSDIQLSIKIIPGFRFLSVMFMTMFHIFMFSVMKIAILSG